MGVCHPASSGILTGELWTGLKVAPEPFILQGALGLCGGQQETGGQAGDPMVTLCEHPFSLKLHSFEVLGQDFLIFGSLAKATAATSFCQTCENPKAIAKAFIFYQDKTGEEKVGTCKEAQVCEIPDLLL